mmetsp:Transcript_41585/g.120056  ORF Transcript_41585/g.120056 Transcript_41585/m.120056 type:complete len:224 (+) Transcript_41585:1950-2621(+)
MGSERHPTAAGGRRGDPRDRGGTSSRGTGAELAILLRDVELGRGHRAVDPPQAGRSAGGAHRRVRRPGRSREPHWAVGGDRREAVVDRSDRERLAAKPPRAQPPAALRVLRRGRQLRARAAGLRARAHGDPGTGFHGFRGPESADPGRLPFSHRGALRSRGGWQLGAGAARRAAARARAGLGCLYSFGCRGGALRRRCGGHGRHGGRLGRAGPLQEHDHCRCS